MNELTAAQLLLPLDEWNALEKPQDAVFQEWLAAWNAQESRPVPNDDVRQKMRYGHYLGWIAARRANR